MEVVCQLASSVDDLIEAKASLPEYKATVLGAIVIKDEVQCS